MKNLRLTLRWLLAAWLIALGGCGRDRVAELVAQLEHPEVQQRRAAARELADLGREASAAVPALNQALTDDDSDVRRLAIHAISRVGPQAESYLTALRQALDDDELSVRLAAAFAINRIAPEEKSHRQVLIASMQTGDGGIIVAVGQTGAQAAWAVPTLIELLRDRRPGIRRITANCLEQIGPAAEEASQALQQAAEQDPDDRVRLAAAAALQKITGDQPASP